MFVAVLTLVVSALTLPAADPSRAQLQGMLLTAPELSAATSNPADSWKAQPVVVRNPPGPAGTSDSSGCVELDSAVLSHNTGLIDSGVGQYVSNEGEWLEETVVYDPRAAADVQQLETAIERCKVMRFPDGPPVTVTEMELGDGVTGFRASVAGTGVSIVLVGAKGDYVVELIASDNNHPDSYYQALLLAAFAQLA